MEFSENLKKLRLREGLTQDAFAERLGISKNLIYTHESEKSVPTITTLLKICNEFNVTPNWLLGFDLEDDVNEVQKQINGIVDELETLCETIMYVQKKLKGERNGF